jgi:4-carboxymuconolactone decarboxylase
VDPIAGNASTSRIPYLAAADAPSVVAKRLNALPDLNVFKLLAHAHDTFDAWLRFGGSLLSDLTLDDQLRELAILRVAHLTPAAEYEWVQHGAIAREIGVEPARIAAARYEAAADADDALVLSFTEQVVLRAAPDDETFIACAARFSSREIVELVLVIGQYMMLGRLMATARIDIDLPTHLDTLVRKPKGRHG